MAKKSRRKKPAKARIPVVIRAFEGLNDEGDWIALREFIASATAKIELIDGRTVQFVTLLPGAGVGVVRPDGEIWIALQVMHNHGDVSRDLAHVIELAADTEPGNPIRMTPPEPGARLQDLIAPESRLEIEVHADFNWWLVDEDRDDPTAQAAISEANASVAPSVRLESVDGAWISEMGDHTYLRWALPEYDEDELVNAFSRLRARGEDQIVSGTRLIGMFRAHGVLVPVWEVDDDLPASTIDQNAGAFYKQLTDELANLGPLEPKERSIKHELLSRQVTIR